MCDVFQELFYNNWSTPFLCQTLLFQLVFISISLFVIRFLACNRMHCNKWLWCVLQIRTILEGIEIEKKIMMSERRKE